MTENEPIPKSFPPMGAEFKKPYMEFEYDGKIYRLEELSGGHNGKGAAAACQTYGAKWDEVKQRWVVKIENNMIDIDLSQQPNASINIPEKQGFLKKLSILSSPRRSKRSVGYIIAEGGKDEHPKFPIDCEFYMHIRVKAPGKPSLTNPVPFKLFANGLNSWPPPVGTVYAHNDTVELYPEWVPLAKRLMKPIIKILPGDETIITDVFEVKDSLNNRSSLLRRVINWLT